jgi:hypothetical protein
MEESPLRMIFVRPIKIHVWGAVRILKPLQSGMSPHNAMDRHAALEHWVNSTIYQLVDYYAGGNTVANRSGPAHNDFLPPSNDRLAQCRMPYGLMITHIGNWLA